MYFIYTILSVYVSESQCLVSSFLLRKLYFICTGEKIKHLLSSFLLRIVGKL